MVNLVLYQALFYLFAQRFKTITFGFAQVFIGTASVGLSACVVLQQFPSEINFGVVGCTVRSPPVNNISCVNTCRLER